MWWTWKWDGRSLVWFPRIDHDCQGWTYRCRTWGWYHETYYTCGQHVQYARRRSWGLYLHWYYIGRIFPWSRYECIHDGRLNFPLGRSIAWNFWSSWRNACRFWLSRIFRCSFGGILWTCRSCDLFGFTQPRRYCFRCRCCESTRWWLFRSSHGRNLIHCPSLLGIR